MGQVVVQKLKKEVKDKLEKGIVYYSMISTLNNLRLTKRQIQLLAFTAVRGTITPMSARQEFADLFKSSLNTLENLKGELAKRGLLVNKGGMYKVNPSLDLDFTQDLVLHININERISDEGK